MMVTPLSGQVYQAVAGFEDHLVQELERFGRKREQYGDALFFAANNSIDSTATVPVDRVFWHQNCWLQPFRVEFDSINEAASSLCAIQRNWAVCRHTQFRRSSLIAAKLPPLSGRPRPFPWLLPDSPVGAWTLLDAHTMIACARCSSPFPGGVINFTEDRTGPPSRAYLKLWEALVRLRRWPAPGEHCLDAGASPGGWTWALSKLGAQVTAVDRAPLDDRVAGLKGVTVIRHSAFTLRPEDIGHVDWLFCDVICYPPRLYKWIEKWLASGLCENFVCTIKMQGAADFDTPLRFAEIPGSTIAHLYYNKHELTWTKKKNDA